VAAARCRGGHLFKVDDVMGAVCEVCATCLTPPLSERRTRPRVPRGGASFLGVTTAEFFADRCPDELCMVVGLLSRGHRGSLKEAKRPDGELRVGDIVQSVALLDEAAAVAASLGLPWPPGSGAVVEAAARNGCVAVVERALDLGCPKGDAWDAAILGGEIDVMRTLHARTLAGDRLRVDSCRFAVQHNQLPALKWLHVHGFAWDSSVLARACKLGHLNIVQYMIVKKVTIRGGWALQCAIEGGHVHLLAWFADFFHWDAYGSVCALAASKGQLHVLQWLRAQTPPCAWGPCTRMAAAHGHIDVLKWAIAQGCPWGANTCSHAAVAGQFEMLIWLRAQTPPCPWNLAPNGGMVRTVQDTQYKRFAPLAASSGRLDVLKWVHYLDPQPGDPAPRWFYTETCTAAAARGDVPMLTWLRGGSRFNAQPICPWDANACTAAAKHGHLETLQWLRARRPPCPWSPAAPSAALEGGYVSIAEWLIHTGCPCTDEARAEVAAAKAAREEAKHTFSIGGTEYKHVL